MLGIRHHKTTAVDLFLGDITEFVCDAMVNAANTELKGGGGVDGAIHRAGGPSLMQELKKYRGCPTGEAVVTGAGELPAKWVIHAVGPVWRGGKTNEAKLLAAAYASCLRQASDLGASHIAFPSISTGVYSYPIGDAAAIAMTAVKGFIDSQPAGQLRRITFVLFDNKHYECFRNQLEITFPENDL